MSDDRRPPKISGFVTSVGDETWWGRVIIEGESGEYEAEFDKSVWPEADLDLLQTGIFFTFPRRRDRKLFVASKAMRRPTRRDLKRAEREAKKLMRDLGIEGAVEE